MSEWLTFVKAYAEKNNIPYKQALRDASPTYKTRNEIKSEVVVPIVEPTRKFYKKKNLLNLNEKILLKNRWKILL